MWPMTAPFTDIDTPEDYERFIPFQGSKYLV